MESSSNKQPQTNKPDQPSESSTTKDVSQSEFISCSMNRYKHQKRVAKRETKGSKGIKI